MSSDVHLEDWKHLWKHLWKVWKHNLLIKSFGLEASNQIFISLELDIGRFQYASNTSNTTVTMWG